MPRVEVWEDPVNYKDITWRSAISILLGVITVVLIRLISTLMPYGSSRIYVSDLITIPASFIAPILYPDGPPQGGMPWAGTVFDVLVYAFIWFIIIGWRKRRSRSAII